MSNETRILMLKTRIAKLRQNESVNYKLIAKATRKLRALDPLF